MKPAKEFKACIAGAIYPTTFSPKDDLDEEAQEHAFHMGALNKKDAAAVEKRIKARDAKSKKTVTGAGAADTKPAKAAGSGKVAPENKAEPKSPEEKAAPADPEDDQNIAPADPAPADPGK